ncbi:Plastocyanin-like domain [Musa troglodytarum]|uniref:Plastocyanin-like domain n=1 Tax=Musa troglodytarum TaxID=320322 RepID=A0A9E7KAF6_9LILI|nr:Plastocyanin-like domain [Musa troglodytarum]
MANGASMAAMGITVLFMVISFTTSAADSPPAPPYTNHTVGGAAGWFFNSTSNSSVTNYSDWASTQNFFLGDYLIFNTDSSNTVIQTLNATTYALCNFTDDNGNDTTFYYDGGEDPKAGVTVPVALTEEGVNYFFSAADGGAQCLQGMRFRITVAHGRGLPPSLNQPPPPPFVEVAPPPPDIMVSPSISRGRTFHARAPLVLGIFVGIHCLLRSA